MQNGSVNERSAAQSAALRGAALAFANGKPPIAPKPKAKKYIALDDRDSAGYHGALAAASKVAGARQSSGTSILSAASGEDLRLGYQNTGSSIGESVYTGGSVQNRLDKVRGRGLLQPPGSLGQGRRSTSMIAATLAASRSPTVSPNPTGQQGETRKMFTRTHSMRSVSSSSDVVDSTPVPSTKGLIGMFEGKEERERVPPVKPTIARSISHQPKLSLSVPERAVPNLSREVSRMPKPVIRSPKSNKARPQSEYFPPQSSRLESRPRAVPKSSATPTKPISIPHPRAKASNHVKTPPSSRDVASSEDSTVFPSSQNTDHNYSPDHHPSFRAAIAEQRRLTSPSTTSLQSTTATIDSMANAIVAASLASSRAVSPSKSSQYPPVPPARKRGRHHFFHAQDESRTPSPAKQVGMKTTLRKVKSQESIDEGEKRRGKKNLVKKHPHKHHEGDRKRWRDAVTERERKRYEAVWASNRGLWLKDTESSKVCSLVVRDVWSRSRLNADVLEEVYALVDRAKVRSLEKEEFVIGMWLIDQWLKGRKLPTRVSDNVWRSVGGTGGIKVHGPNVRR